MNTPCESVQPRIDRATSPYTPNYTLRRWGTAAVAAFVIGGMGSFSYGELVKRNNGPREGVDGAQIVDTRTVTVTMKSGSHETGKATTDVVCNTALQIMDEEQPLDLAAKAQVGDTCSGAADDLISRSPADNPVGKQIVVSVFGLPDSDDRTRMNYRTTADSISDWANKRTQQS